MKETYNGTVKWSASGKNITFVDWDKFLLLEHGERCEITDHMWIQYVHKELRRLNIEIVDARCQEDKTELTKLKEIRSWVRSARGVSSRNHGHTVSQGKGGESTFDAWVAVAIAVIIILIIVAIIVGTHHSHDSSEGGFYQRGRQGGEYHITSGGRRSYYHCKTYHCGG